MDEENNGHGGGPGMPPEEVFGFSMFPQQGWGAAQEFQPGLNHGLNPAFDAQQIHMQGGPGGYHPDMSEMYDSPPMEQQGPHHLGKIGPGTVSVGGSMDPLENLLGVFPCVRLRGLPFEASLEDVLVFFQGLVVLDIVMLGNELSRDGGSRGEAFVVFANPLDFQMALQRDHQNMGRRYIEVFQGKRSDYYAAIALQHNQTVGNQNKNGEGDEQSKEKPPLGGAWSGNGPTPAQSMSSHSGRGNSGGGHGGGRGKGSGGRGGRGSGGGIQVGEHTGFLRMRGLPFSSTKKDILQFFKEYKPVETSITFTYRSDGRATGEGYAGFASADDAKDAMALHKKSMGSRYIELFISSKEEHARSMARSNGR